MAINDIKGTGTNAAQGAALTGSDAPVTAKTGDKQLGRDDFMKLLVAQLKNQDPNSPLDTKELVTQLSQLTSVEQLVTIGDKLGALTNATNGMAANQSAGLIGKRVEGVDDSLRLGATGAAGAAVNFGQDADKVTVSVRNEAGRVVRTVELGSMRAGQRVIEWDGKTDAMERATPGTYTLEVLAKDKAGNPVATDMNVSGVVTSVSYENGGPELVVGDRRVPLSSITSIGQ